MNTSSPLFTVINGADKAQIQRREDGASRRFALGLAVFFLLALVTLTWLIISSSVSDVSAAAGVAAAQTAPQVPYFPSLHVNQATEVEPPPPTF